MKHKDLGAHDILHMKLVLQAEYGTIASFKIRSVRGVKWVKFRPKVRLWDLQFKFKNWGRVLEGRFIHITNANKLLKYDEFWESSPVAPRGEKITMCLADDHVDALSYMDQARFFGFGGTKNTTLIDQRSKLNV